jgi:alpha-beta hydrolase superfamily lysophospholipase
MRHRSFTTAGIGGLDLRAQAWLPDAGPKGVIALAHGLAEHGGRYARLAHDLVTRHFAVYAVDQRGHGESPGPRANIERFAHLVSDFCVFAGRAAREHPGTPLYLLGHSMGGAVAFAAALRLQDQLRGLVLSAPALGTNGSVSALQRMAVKAIAAVRPNTGALQLSPRAISRDAEVVRDYESDPLVFHGMIPARTVVELLDAMAGFPDLAPRLKLPTLVLHGTADTLVPVAGVRPIYQAINEKQRSIKFYDGLYHEVFNEPERAQVTSDLLQWLER